MHGVEKSVKALELSLKSNQGLYFNADFNAVKVLTEFVVNVDLDQSLMLDVLIVRVASDRAGSLVFFRVKSELNEVDSIRILCKDLLDVLVSVEVGSWKS